MLNPEEKVAGADWFHAFLKCNSRLSLRKPEGLSHARAEGLCKEEVVHYFSILKEVLNDYQLFDKSRCIYNMVGCTGIMSFSDSIVSDDKFSPSLLFKESPSTDSTPTQLHQVLLSPPCCSKNQPPHKQLLPKLHQTLQVLRKI